jgi:hypothetical protein
LRDKSFGSFADGAAGGGNELFGFDPGKSSILMQESQRILGKRKSVN